MDITVTNTSIAGKTEAEVASLLATASTEFAGCKVAFVNAEATVLAFEQSSPPRCTRRSRRSRSLLGLKPTTPAAAVVVAVQVAATPAAVEAVAASPDVAVAAAAAPPVAAATQ